jgi:hypothetical protein
VRLEHFDDRLGASQRGDFDRFIHPVIVARMNVGDRQVPPPGELCLDQLGHFVPDLDAAAKVFEDAGFSVTPRSDHVVSGKPAGTSNRCVMFEEGYIEILAPTSDTPNSARVRKRMELFVGVHLACFGTRDCEADHRRLAAHGFAPEPLVELRRQVEGVGEVGFRVTHLPPARMPEGRVQYCQHLTPARVWREGYVNPFRLSAVYVVADDPAQTAARWGHFAGLIPKAHDGLVQLETARGRALIGERTALERILGAVPAAPALAGYEIACRDAKGFLTRCSKAGMRVKGNAVTLPAALGGAWVVV